MRRALWTLVAPGVVLSSILSGPAARAGPIVLQLNQTYAQNFDSLAATKENQDYPWVNDKTIPGWFSNRDSYRVNKGTAVTFGSLYSFGSQGAADRALGSLATASVPKIFYGADFQNGTNQRITSLTIQYTGEQWADNRTTATTLAFTLTTNPFAPTPIPKLDFTSPTNKDSGALDGNAAANRALISLTITGLAINPGDDFSASWTDNKPASGQDQGLGIDDFSIKIAATAPVPEPLSLELMGVGVLALVGCRWASRRRARPIGGAPRR